MFHNREDAGLQLARALRGREFNDPLVLAIPRGGLAVGAVLARELGAELDVVLVRKLRAPDQPELALGAISEDGKVYLNSEVLDAIGPAEEYLAQRVDAEPERQQRRRDRAASDARMPNGNRGR